MLRKIMTFGVLALMISLLVFGACAKKKKKDLGDEGDTKKPMYSSKGDEGTITGKISFDGTPPAAQKIDMSQDANCVSAPGDKNNDNVLIDNGKLVNVFVYLKGGNIEKFSYPVPSEPVVLDQLGCKYHPRTLGIQVNQTFEVVNSDKTTHNVHPSPKSNSEWNQSQPAGSPPIEKKFTRKEVLIPVKCNQHPWMKANIAVLDHPYFAVSEKDGSYTIKNVPPGSYTLVFWHEVFHEQQQQITVAAKESKTVDISFKSDTAYLPGSLPVGPALVLP
jgi:plastocyanin